MRDYSKLEKLFPKLNIRVLEDTIETFEIENDLEFIAQCAHESNNFKTFKENLNYSARGLMLTWPNRFNQVLADRCQRNPQEIANVVYSNRMGNSKPGDGWKYIGRGAIQVTGFNNYFSVEGCLIDYGICEVRGEITDNPELLEKYPFCLYSAGAFWKLNRLDKISDFRLLTKKINGGTMGLSERESILNKIKELY